MQASLIRARKTLMQALYASLAALPLFDGAQAHEGHHAPQTHQAHAAKAKKPELGMAFAIDAKSGIWSLARESTPQGDFAVLRHSGDAGQSWSAPKRINAQPEPIWGSSESPPNLVLGADGAMYASWIRPGARNFAGDVRFSRSTDGGQSWSAPVTVHHDRQPITHRFASMASDNSGRLYIAWIDRRDANPAKGSAEAAAVYYAVSTDGGAHWKGDYKLAGSTCECCRISLAPGSAGVPVALWRYVFEGSERDHVLAALNPEGKPTKPMRATFDRWKVDACPHHGPALAITQESGRTVRHAVWFNQDDKEEPHVFYGRLSESGSKVDGQTPLPDGAEHADVRASGARVWVAWKRYDGEKTVAGVMQSQDGGHNWKTQEVAATAGNSDYPRLQLQGEHALLAWNTERDGVIVRSLP